MDPKNKRMILSSRNISYDNVVTIEEQCVYTVNEENPAFTDLTQTALVHAYPYGVAGRIEKFLTGKFVANAPLGRTIMENTVKRVEYETHMNSIFSRYRPEPYSPHQSFEDRFDTFREDLNAKVKEAEVDLSHFYTMCKRAGEQWTSERVEELESFLDEQFETIFGSEQPQLLQKQ